MSFRISKRETSFQRSVSPESNRSGAIAGAMKVLREKQSEAE